MESAYRRSPGTEGYPRSLQLDANPESKQTGTGLQLEEGLSMETWPAVQLVGHLGNVSGTLLNILSTQGLGLQV